MTTPASTKTIYTGSLATKNKKELTGIASLMGITTLGQKTYDLRESIRLGLAESRDMRESKALIGVWNTTTEAKREAKLGLTNNIEAEDDNEPEPEEEEEGSLRRRKLGKHFIDVPTTSTPLSNISSKPLRGGPIQRSLSQTRRLDSILSHHASNPSASLTSGMKDDERISAEERSEKEEEEQTFAWWIVGILTVLEVAWMGYHHLTYTTISLGPFPSLFLSSFPLLSAPIPSFPPFLYSYALPHLFLPLALSTILSFPRTKQGAREKSQFKIGRPNVFSYCVLRISLCVAVGWMMREGESGGRGEEEEREWRGRLIVAGVALAVAFWEEGKE